MLDGIGSMRLARVPRGWTSGIAVAISLAFAMSLAVGLAQGSKPLLYDSLNYWTLGGSFVRRGDFSLLNFSDTLRGYLLPLVYHGLNGAATGLGWRKSALVNIFNAGCFALVGALLAPRLAELCWPTTRWGLARRLGLTILLLVFWHGFLSYSLSDFPALTFMLLAVVASSRPRSLASMALAGLATGAAIDARPSYLPLLALVPLLALLATRDATGSATGRGARARRGAAWAALVLAFAAVSLPQALIAHRHFASWSFVPGTAAHLESLQLTEGMRLQRYDTYIGTGHPPQMFYEDPSGTALLAQQPGATVTGLGQYTGLVFSHPGTMLPLLARHVLNGLDQRYPTPYVEHLDTGSQRGLRIAGLLLVVLALLRLMWPSARRALGRTRWRYPLTLLACCLTAVPSAMETRFMLPAYMLVYTLVLAPNAARTRAETTTARRRVAERVLALASCAAFAALVLIVASGASSHLRFA